MENSEETTTKNPVDKPEYVQEKAMDVEESGGDAIPTTVVRSGKSEGFLQKGSLALRVAALVFSAVSFIIMATIKGFDEFDQSRYVLAAGILSTVYNLFQVSCQSYYLSTGKSLIDTSAIAPSVATLRVIEDELLADHGISNLVAASTSMAFLAFFPMAVSDIISAFKLSPKT
ncbi:hypothetical protein MKX01_031727 [Papaver californicum]|nr:hypothetical protein MKX01_031727 [Papaver californicum]